MKALIHLRRSSTGSGPPLFTPTTAGEADSQGITAAARSDGRCAARKRREASLLRAATGSVERGERRARWKRNRAAETVAFLDRRRPAVVSSCSRPSAAHSACFSSGASGLDRLVASSRRCEVLRRMFASGVRASCPLSSISVEFPAYSMRTKDRRTQRLISQKKF